MLADNVAAMTERLVREQGTDVLLTGQAPTRVNGDLVNTNDPNRTVRLHVYQPSSGRERMVSTNAGNVESDLSWAAWSLPNLVLDETDHDHASFTCPQGTFRVWRRTQVPPNGAPRAYRYDLERLHA